MQPTLKQRLIECAINEGFSDIRVTRPDSIPFAADRLAEFVSKERHGQMEWMEKRMHWRGDPTALWPQAKSVIVLAESYSPDHDPTAVLDHPDRGAISIYAQNKDYHDIVKKRLKRVGRWIIEQSPSDEIKVFVDTAPVMEKPLAAAAGLGWQGKHTNLVSRNLGNWFFIGSIFSTIEFPIDQPGADSCGTCRSCLDACPTGAFPQPYQIDAKRCISYLTIEHEGPVDLSLRPLMGNHIYGCDDCLAVCPWNKFAKAAKDPRYLARDDLSAPVLSGLAALNDQDFRAKFSGSPIKRTGRNRFVRNVLYAIGNSGLAKLIPAAERLVADTDPTVADAATWALHNLRNLRPNHKISG